MDNKQTDGIFDLIERRIMKQGDVRFLDGIDEPIGIETAKYINNQSMALHDYQKVALSFAAMADDLRKEIADLKAEIARLKGDNAS